MAAVGVAGGKTITAEQGAWPCFEDEAGHRPRLIYRLRTHRGRKGERRSFADVDQLVAMVKNRLKRIQYRPELVDAFLVHTELTLEPQTP